MGCSISRDFITNSKTTDELEENYVPPPVSSKTPLEYLEAEANSAKKRSTQHFFQNIVTVNDGKEIRDFYDIDQMPVLGSGITGQVKICIHKETKIQYALKILVKKKLKGDKIEQLKNEITIMAGLDHPQILRLLEYFETPEVIYLVLELCRGGELLDRLNEQKGRHYCEQTACDYIHTMLNAVGYCHNHNIVHRDLKLENFLFVDGTEESALKLIDFGLSQHFDPDESLRSAVGTPYYVAPEVLQGPYDAKCDIWSMGVITYMLLSGSPPFYGKTDAGTLKAVKEGKFHFSEGKFGMISAEAKDFITTCLNKRVKARPTAVEALKHDWFKLLKKTDSQKIVTLNIVEQLKRFVKKSSLEKLCMEVVSHTLLSGQVDMLRKEFVKFDITETGEISYGDLHHTLKRTGSFMEEDLQSLFSGVNFDKTETIRYHEFLAATMSSDSMNEANLRVAFDRISSHNACITFEDIVELLGVDSSEGEVADMLKEHGLNRQSQIFFTQFKSIMTGSSNSPLARSPRLRKSLSFMGDERSRAAIDSETIVLQPL